MKYSDTLSDQDYGLIRSELSGFIPDEIYDMHVPPYNSALFASNAWSFLKEMDVLGCEGHRKALLRYMPIQTIHGLYFGMLHGTANREEMNERVSTKTMRKGLQLSKALKVVVSGDNPL